MIEKIDKCWCYIRRCLLIVAFCFLLVFFNSVDVQASNQELTTEERTESTTEVSTEESTEDSENESNDSFYDKGIYNDIGHCMKGYFRKYSESDNWKYDDIDVFSTLGNIDKYPDVVPFIFIEVVENGGSKSYAVNISGKWSRSYKYLDIPKKNGDTLVDTGNSNGEAFTYIYSSHLGSFSDDNAETNYFETDIPIFKVTKFGEITEDIQKYIDEGDLSGAENEYDLEGGQPDYSNEIEKPTNLVTYGKYNLEFKDFNPVTPDSDKMAVGVVWDVPSSPKEYSYDVKVKVHFQVLMAKGVPSEYKDSNAIYVVTDYPYDTGNSVDINTGLPVDRQPGDRQNFVLNNDVIMKAIKQTFDASEIKGFFIRPTIMNVYVRNRLGNECSGWVNVTINASGGSHATYEDDNGNYIEDEDYNGTDVDNTDGDKPLDGFDDKIDDNFNPSGIISFIKSGFGLMGNYGLIALMSKVFLYIPARVWDLIEMGLAAAILIMIIALLKKFVF